MPGTEPDYVDSAGRRVTRGERRSMARAVARSRSEPICCPLCARQLSGLGLVKHLDDVHNAVMSIRRRESTP